MTTATIYRDITKVNGELLFKAGETYEVFYKDEFYVKIVNGEGFKILVDRDFDMDVNEGEDEVA